VADKVQKSDPRLLAGLLDRHLPAKCEWTADECGAIFRHQIQTPIQFELSGLDSADAAKVRHLAAARDLMLKSFRDLFHHPEPPLVLLRITKDFAKASSYHPASGLPEDVAKTLYILSIAVARLRCGVMISELDEPALEKGVRWAIQRPWIDDASRQLLTEAYESIIAARGTK
jgi:hypothetical protein